MIHIFRYEGNTPSKKNQKRIVRRKNGAPFIMASTDFTAWHKEASWLITLQKNAMPRGIFPIQHCQHVVLRLYFKDRRVRDCTNTAESIMDLLVDVGALADDSWAITGPLYIFPALRPDRPGWEAALVTFDAAPGPSQEHRVTLPPGASA